MIKAIYERVCSLNHWYLLLAVVVVVIAVWMFRSIVLQYQQPAQPKIVLSERVITAVQVHLDALCLIEALLVCLITFSILLCIYTGSVRWHDVISVGVQMGLWILVRISGQVLRVHMFVASPRVSKTVRQVESV